LLLLLLLLLLLVAAPALLCSVLVFAATLLHFHACVFPLESGSPLGSGSLSGECAYDILHNQHNIHMLLPCCGILSVILHSAAGTRTSSDSWQRPSQQPGVKQHWPMPWLLSWQQQAG
jgi:hypothetical protein